MISLFIKIIKVEDNELGGRACETLYGAAAVPFVTTREMTQHTGAGMRYGWWGVSDRRLFLFQRFPCFFSSFFVYNVFQCELFSLLLLLLYSDVYIHLCERERRELSSLSFPPTTTETRHDTTDTRHVASSFRFLSRFRFLFRLSTFDDSRERRCEDLVQCNYWMLRGIKKPQLSRVIIWHEVWKSKKIFYTYNIYNGIVKTKKY